MDYISHVALKDFKCIKPTIDVAEGKVLDGKITFMFDKTEEILNKVVFSDFEVEVYDYVGDKLSWLSDMFTLKWRKFMIKKFGQEYFDAMQELRKQNQSKLIRKISEKIRKLEDKVVKAKQELGNEEGKYLKAIRQIDLIEKEKIEEYLN